MQNNDHDFKQIFLQNENETTLIWSVIEHEWIKGYLWHQGKDFSPLKVHLIIFLYMWGAFRKGLYEDFRGC